MNTGSEVPLQVKFLDDDILLWCLYSKESKATINGVLYSAVFTYEIGRIVNARETRIYLLESFISVYITCKLVRQKISICFIYLFIYLKKM